MTVREALASARALLAAGGCGDPGLEAELLARHVLGMARHELVLAMGSEMGPDKEADLSALARRRAARTPLQHLTGEAWFMGRRFSAGPSALVPRPETETVTEAFIALLGPRPRMLLDVGTGSGVIAVTLALRYPDAFVIGSDVSIEALRLAAGNRRMHGTRNLALAASDSASAFRPGFDGIVANLPYIPSREIPLLEPEVRDGDPERSLDGGEDGLDLVRRLAGEAAAMLVPGGVLVLEASPGGVETMAAEMEGSGGWASVRTGADLSGRPRWVAAEPA